MPRVIEITEHGGAPILGHESVEGHKHYGDTLNRIRVLAHCPRILRAAKRFYASFNESGLLPEK